MAALFFFSLLGVSYCVYMNSASPLREFEYFAVAGSLALLAGALYATTPTTLSTTLAVVLALPLWWPVVRLRYTRGRQQPRQTTRAGIAPPRHVPVIAYVNPGPVTPTASTLARVPLRVLLSERPDATTPVPPSGSERDLDYQLAPLEGPRYTKRRL